MDFKIKINTWRLLFTTEALNLLILSFLSSLYQINSTLTGIYYV